MKITQLKELVTKAVAQTTGAKLEDLATSTLVDMGKSVLDSGGVEVFTKSKEQGRYGLLKEVFED